MRLFDWLSFLRRSRRAIRTNREASQATSSPSAATAGWLSPIELARDLDEPSAPESNVMAPTTSKSAKTSTRASRRRAPEEERRRRASSKGFLSMTLADYLSLLDWTGRQMRRDKRGAIPAEMQPLFARLKISGEGWFDLIQDFSRLFRRAAGRPESLATEAARRWLQGIANSRALFA